MSESKPATRNWEVFTGRGFGTTRSGHMACHQNTTYRRQRDSALLALHGAGVPHAEIMRILGFYCASTVGSALHRAVQRIEQCK